VGHGTLSLFLVSSLGFASRYGVVVVSLRWSFRPVSDGLLALTFCGMRLSLHSVKYGKPVFPTRSLRPSPSSWLEVPSSVVFASTQSRERKYIRLSLLFDFLPRSPCRVRISVSPSFVVQTGMVLSPFPFTLLRRTTRRSDPLFLPSPLFADSGRRYGGAMVVHMFFAPVDTTVHGPVCPYSQDTYPSALALLTSPTPLPALTVIIFAC